MSSLERLARGVSVIDDGSGLINVAGGSWTGVIGEGLGVSSNTSSSAGKSSPITSLLLQFYSPSSNL